MGRMVPADKALEVGVVTGDPVVFAHNERLRGFREYLATNFPKITIDAVVASEDDDYRCLRRRAEDDCGLPYDPRPLHCRWRLRRLQGPPWQLTTRMKFHVITMAEVPSTLDFMKKRRHRYTVVEDAEKQAGSPSASPGQELLNGQKVEDRILTKNAIRTKEYSTMWSGTHRNNPLPPAPKLPEKGSDPLQSMPVRATGLVNSGTCPRHPCSMTCSMRLAGFPPCPPW